MTTQPIVLFDGVCRFCDGAVNFLIDHDPQGRIRFAALQSESGQALLKQFHLDATTLDTLVLVEGNRHYVRSTAALRIARFLNLPWPGLSMFLLVPVFLRDWVYRMVAANRYRWFGQMDACRMPTPELRQRFLD
ncbi:MAG: thiol-disulfide oxidoreductase DCC family protein [Gemmataceae bacterium]